MPLLDLTVDLELDGPQQGWTDVTRDVLVRGGVSWDYGLPGSRPHDHVAGIGECRFLLDNSPANSAGLAGYYAPGHPDTRPGFELGIACRISLAHDGTVRRKLYYLESVDARAGHLRLRDDGTGGRDGRGGCVYDAAQAMHPDADGEGGQRGVARGQQRHRLRACPRRPMHREQVVGDALRPITWPARTRCA